MKPPVIYLGSKSRIASQITALFPADPAMYVEPYAGSLSVFLASSFDPAQIPVVLNDLDGQIANFWRVLRDRPEQLMWLAECTPHSRALLADPLDGSPDDDVRRAWATWVRLTQGRSGALHRNGWRYYSTPRKGTTAYFWRYMAAYRDRIPPAAWRLRDAQIECDDALTVINRYGRDWRALLYCDPPYLPDVRMSGRYRLDADGAHHEALLAALLETGAKVALSGYPHPMYDEALAGWDRTEIHARTQHSPRVEVLWRNYSL